MDITSLNRRELIDKLAKIYQLSCRYDNVYQNLLEIQKKMIPDTQPKLIATLKGHLGGSYGIVIFLAIVFLFGFRTLFLVEAILIALHFNNSLVRFLIALILTAIFAALLTGLSKNLINIVIAEINKRLIALAQEKHQKNAQYNQQVEKEMTPYLQKMQEIQRQYRSAGITIPQRYSATTSIKRILELLQDGRADTWASAANLYEEELSRMRIESHMRKIQGNQAYASQQYQDAINTQNQMLANQQMMNMLMAWNLSYTLMR